MTNKQKAKTLGVEPIIKHRLEYLRGEIIMERISQLEIAELQSLAEHIEPGDNLLLEWAGIPENQSICVQCDKKINDDVETVFDKWGDPNCTKCFNQLSK